ncbi:MAG TPA: TonB-dependent receptor [Thermoanaerobaculia bacterium]|nr:TonB-dependent receptor [Thermoanaerobaculia bacterium]
MTGRVVDETGGALPGVSVTATNNATGLNRTVVTEPDGSYRFPSLPAGTYTVLADLSGFGTVSTTDVVLNVARDRELEITLKQAAVKESITVTAEAPLIADAPAIGTTVSQDELENLPLNGRQFANLGSLAPGTQLAYNADPTKPGQLTIALNGGIGRNVNFTVDGGDNTDDTIGGALQNFNLEAVQEFTIQTQSYKAEYGRSSGGVLTVVTKTGTNEFAGSLYGFYRDDRLNSITESERLGGGEKAEYERKQYGGSIGGPIVRDRAHFFATYEETERPSSYIVNTGGIFPEFDGDAIPIPFTDKLITAKATANLSASQFLQVRYGYQKNADKYGAGQLTLPSALGTLTNEYESYLLGHTWTLGGSRVNDFVYQWTKFNNAITADSNEPALAFPSGVALGQNVNTPQTTNQEKSQFRDDFSFSTTLGGRRHDFKTGAQWIHEPILGGSFTTGTAGQFTMRDDDPNSPVIAINVNGGFAGFSTPVDQYSYYFQDDIHVNDRLTVNAGLRYDLWTGFDLDQSTNPVLQALSTQTQYNDSYYLEAFRGWDGQLENDTNNIAPRLGFSYDLRGDSRHMIRGGLGRYYDFPYTNATILFPGEAILSNFGTIYSLNDPNGIRNPDGTFFRPGQPLPPGGETPIGFTLPANVGHPSITNTPYSDQVSLGYSTEVTNWLGVNVDVTHIEYRDIPYRFRYNGFLDNNGSPITSRRFSSIGITNNNRMWIGDGEADYDGLNIGFRARMSGKLEMQGFYTLSKIEGNVLAGADEFRLTNANHQPDRAGDLSVNFRDPLCDQCFGPLDTDARHKVTISTLYRAPFGINVSGVLRYRSALPYSERDGRDLNGDGQFSDLVAGTENVNNLRGESFSQLDVRLSKDFRLYSSLGIELIAEMFNVFNEINPSAINGQRFTASGAPNPNFQQATAFAGDPLQGEQRLIQLGARFRF